MADEKTTVIGKVAVKIFPDTSEFYREAKRDLESAERRLDDVEVDLTLNDDRVMRQLRELLARLNQTARRSEVEVGAKLDGSAARAEAKVLKAQLEKSLDNVNAEVKVTTNGKVLDDLKKAELFQPLKHQEVFDPSSLKQYRDRIKEINDQTRALAKVEAQRADAQKKNLAEQSRLMKQRLDAEQEAAKSRVAVRDAQGKSIRDQIAGQQKVEALIQKASDDAKRAADAQAKAAKDVEDAHRRAYIEQVQAEREMRNAIASQTKSQRKALADQAKMTREFAQTSREASRLRSTIENLKITKVIDPEVYGDLRALQTELNDLHARVRVEVDSENRERLRHKAAQIKDEIEDKLDNIKADVKPDLSLIAMKYAQIALAKLARTRVVELVPRLSKVATVKVATALAALTGARGAGRILSDLGQAFGNIDKNLPKVATLATGLSTIAGWAFSAVANLFSLANSLAAVGQAGLALPGILGGIAIGTGITVIALSDLNKRIPEAKKGWNELKKTIKGNFWKEAEDPIRRLGKELFPGLRAGIAQTSTSLGKFFGLFAKNLGKELKGNPLRNMFRDLDESIKITAVHTDSFAKIIRILGEQGAGQLPRLARFFGDLTDRFSGFLDKANKSGELQEWINEGIEAMKQLGDVVKGTVRIFSGLGKAAIAGGASTLESLGKRLNAIADVINGPAFQKQMIATLSAANKAMEDIGKTAGPAVTNMFMTLGKTLEKVFPILGRTVGLALKTIADAIADPRLQTGIVDFFKGVEKGVTALAPAFKDIAPAIGTFLSLLGSLIKDFAPIGALILGTLSKAFIILEPAIAAVAGALSGAFLSVLKALAPVLLDVATKLAPIIEQVGGQLAQALSDAAPYLAEFAKVLGDALGEALRIIGDRLPEIVDKLLPQLLSVVKNIVPKLPGLIDGFLGLVDALVNTSLIEDIGKLAGSLLDLTKDQLLPQMAKDLSTTASSLGELLGYTAQFVTFLDSFKKFGEVLSFISGVANPFQPIIDFFAPGGPLELIKTASSDTGQSIGDLIIKGLIVGMGLALPGVSGFLLGLTEMIPQWKGPPDTDATLLTPAGTSIIQSLIDGMNSVDLQGALGLITTAITGAFAAAGTLLTSAGTAIVDGLKAGMNPDPATGQASSVKTGIGQKFSDAGSYLSGRGGDLIKGLSGGMGKLMGDVKDKGKAALTAAKDGTNGSDSALHSAGTSVISGFVEYIERGFDRVQGVLNRLTNLLPSWKGPPSTDKVILKEAGQLVIQGFVEGLESQFSSVRATLGSLSDEIGKTEIAAPSIGKISQADMSKMRAGVSGSIAVSAASTADGATATDGGITFKIDNHNPVAEPTSVTITKALRTAGQMGVLRK